MSIYINTNHGTINHIEDSNVTISADILKSVPSTSVDATDVPFEEITDTTYCEYINREKLAENNIRTIIEFEEMLRKAVQEPAPQLNKFLKQYEKIGYLDFKGHDKKQIFENLKAHFKDMKDYSYQNFAAYF